MYLYRFKLLSYHTNSTAAYVASRWQYTYSKRCEQDNTKNATFSLEDVVCQSTISLLIHLASEQRRQQSFYQGRLEDTTRFNLLTWFCVTAGSKIPKFPPAYNPFRSPIHSFAPPGSLAELHQYHRCVHRRNPRLQPAGSPFFAIMMLLAGNTEGTLYRRNTDENAYRTSARTDPGIHSCGVRPPSNCYSCCSSTVIDGCRRRPLHPQ